MQPFNGENGSAVEPIFIRFLLYVVKKNCEKKKVTLQNAEKILLLKNIRSIQKKETHSG